MIKWRLLILFLILPNVNGILDSSCNLTAHSGSIVKDLRCYNSYLNDAVSVDVLKALEKVGDLATLLDNFGVPYSKNVAALIEFGTKDLKNDTYEALMDNHKSTMGRFTELEEQVSEVQTGVRFYTFEVNYDLRVRGPLDHLSDIIEKCTNPSKYQVYCKTAFYGVCTANNPKVVLQYLFRGLAERCNPPTDESFELYLKYIDKVDNIEKKKLNLGDSNYDERSDYEAWKSMFLSSFLVQNNNAEAAEKAFEEMKSKEITIGDVIIYFQQYSMNSCFLARVYDHYNQTTRPFVANVKYFFNDISKTMEMFIACGNFSSPRDPMYKQGRHLYERTLNGMNNFVKATMEKSWPKVFAVKAVTAIKKQKDLNTTAAEILEAITPVGEATYKYLVFVSSYVNDTEDVHVFSSCQQDNFCHTAVEGDKEYHIFRYQFYGSYSHRLQHFRGVFEAFEPQIFLTTYEHDKVGNLKDLHNLIQNKTEGGIEYKSFIFFHESQIRKVDTKIEMGYAVEEFEKLPTYGRIYVFRHHHWTTLQNEEAFFLFYFDRCCEAPNDKQLN